MLPFLKKQEGSVSQPPEALKRESDEKEESSFEQIKSDLNVALGLIQSALSALEKEGQ